MVADIAIPSAGWITSPLIIRPIISRKQQIQFCISEQFNKKLQFKEEPFPSSPEPFGMERFDFYEDRLTLLTRQAVEAEAISVSRGAEILQVSIEEMMELLSDFIE